ncbi:MAG TPA: protein kinase [Candidatus Acidoferrum sp.]|nr:protein kinase [Candidatus Acidoferrum sp.]
MEDNSKRRDAQPLEGNGGRGVPRAEDRPSIPVPDHELVRRIGRGSYGEVWLARHTMGMYRAVKIVYRAAFKEERPFERELSGIRKFEPISRSHEGFIDVLHVGLNDAEGCFYYVMELGDDERTGQTIHPETYSPKTIAEEIAQRGRLPFDECLKLALALSQALAELHKHGLVHRDIKPSNLIFVNGVPKLADIGLVAAANEELSYVGTQGFIPPEGPGTVQADIYSLGKVLYEASTARDRQEFPELPTLLNDFPDRERFLELNEVILTACANTASKRYQTAWDMHAHLVVLANGKSVRRLKALERTFSRLKRIAGVLVLALAVVSLAGYELYRGWKTGLESKQRQVGADVAYGNKAMDAGELVISLPYFADTLRLDKGDEVRERTDRFRFSSVLLECPKLTHFWFGEGDIDDAEFSPDGNRLLVSQFCGKAWIYDLMTDQVYSKPFGHQNGLCGATYSPDGRRALTANQEGSACVWDAGTLKEERHLQQPDRIYSARFSPDGLRVVTSCRDGIARVWDTATGELRLELKGHKDAVLFADFSKDGRLLVTTSRDATARIWDATNGHPVGAALQHERWVTHASFSPDGAQVVTASDDHTARVWEVRTGRRVLPDLIHHDVVESAQFSPDGRLILTASLDGTAGLWLAETHQPLNPNPLLRHPGRVRHASFSRDGHRIATVCADGTVRVWDLAGSAVAPIRKRAPFSDDRSRFLVLTGDTVEVRATMSGKPISPPVTAISPVKEAMLGPGGKFILTVSVPAGNPDGPRAVVEVRESTTGQQVAAPLALPAGATNLSLSNDGKRVMYFDGHGLVVQEIATGAQKTVREGQSEGAVFNPAGTVVASWSGDTVSVCGVATGEPLFGPLKHSFPVKDVEFSGDGSRLVTCGADEGLNACYAQVWDAATGQAIGPHLAHADGVLAARFSPDGKRIATASEDFTASVWDAATGGQVSGGMAHEDQVATACFSPDGRWIVTASPDRTARIWSAETGDPLTPPLRHLAPLTDAHLLANNDVVVVTSSRRNNFWIWNLPVDQRPAVDLAGIAQLLSAHTVNASGRLVPTSSDTLKGLWSGLRAGYPAQFETSAEEITAWHEFQSEDCELRHQWSAAVFHLKQLQESHPGDRGVAERLARANDRLTKDF